MLLILLQRERDLEMEFSAGVQVQNIMEEQPLFPNEQPLFPEEQPLSPKSQSSLDSSSGSQKRVRIVVISLTYPSHMIQQATIDLLC